MCSKCLKHYEWSNYCKSPVKFKLVWETFWDILTDIFCQYKVNLHWEVARSSRARFFVLLRQGVFMPSRAQNYPTQQNKQRIMPGNPWRVLSVNWPLSRFWRYILWRHGFRTPVEISNSAPMITSTEWIQEKTWNQQTVA